MIESESNSDISSAPPEFLAAISKFSSVFSSLHSSHLAPNVNSGFSLAI